MLRRDVALLPQRSDLMTGTVAQALRLTDPDSNDGTLWQVIRLCSLPVCWRCGQGLRR